MHDHKQAVITLSVEIATLREQMRAAETHLEDVKRRLRAREEQLDQLLAGGASQAASDAAARTSEPSNVHTQPGEDPSMETQSHVATSHSGQRMKHDITMCGQTEHRLSLKHTMLYVVRRAVAAGIHPRDLHLHEGTINASTRWLTFDGQRSPAALAQEVKSAVRWFVDEPMIVGDQTWVLTSQWSWDEEYGSSFADLQRIQKNFPQLGLTWRRY